jgi:hypothetical protein
VVNLGAIALALADVEQGIACAGTVLESRTYQVRKKSFLFVSKEQARLKLGASAPAAKELGFAVGASGWVALPLKALPAAAVLRRWITESHALVARPAGPRSAKPKRTTKRR